MATKLLDWPSLWERDHSLNPGDGIRLATDCGHLYAEDGHTLSLEVSASLWRDAAVRWLAENSEHIRIYPAATFGRPTVGVLHDIMDGGPLAYGETGGTLDAALFAAVEAVLRARGK